MLGLLTHVSQHVQEILNVDTFRLKTDLSRGNMHGLTVAFTIFLEERNRQLQLKQPQTKPSCVKTFFCCWSDIYKNISLNAIATLLSHWVFFSVALLTSGKKILLNKFLFLSAC